MKVIFVFLLSTVCYIGYSQESKFYNPAADAKKEIKEAVQRAKKENKFVLIQAGGNWCSWCVEFARFAKADAKVDSIINSDFIWYHLNFSKENKNEDIFAQYAYPQRLGFPVFIILDKKGKPIHIQNSEYLEDGEKSYDKKKVYAFLANWTPSALNPEQNH